MSELRDKLMAIVEDLLRAEPDVTAEAVEAELLAAPRVTTPTFLAPTPSAPDPSAPGVHIPQPLTLDEKAELGRLARQIEQEDAERAAKYGSHASSRGMFGSSSPFARNAPMLTGEQVAARRRFSALNSRINGMAYRGARFTGFSDDTRKPGRETPDVGAVQFDE